MALPARATAGSLTSYRRLLGRRLGLLVAVLNDWEPLLWASLGVVAALIVLGRYPIGQNSDGLLETIMSVQQLTVFFWGQDRFANLLPALTAGVTDPHANAICQLALRTLLGLLAPLFFCVLATPRDDAGTAWRATAAASALLLAFMPQREVFEAYIEASPYGTSFALAGFALLAFRRAALAMEGNWSRPALRAIGLVLTCAAYMVNASMVLVAAPLLAGELLLFGSALAMDFSVASLAAVMATAALIAGVPNDTPHTPFGFGETTIGLSYYGGAMLGKPGRFFACVLPATGVSLLLLRYGWRDRRVSEHLGQAGILVAALTISFIATALSSWVILNSMHPRYLVPEYFLTASLGGVSLVHLVRGTVRSGAVQRAVLVGVCACLLLGAMHRTSSSRKEPTIDIVSGASKEVADAVAAAVLERSLDGVAGDYWDVWPAVFQAEQLAYDFGRPVGHVFGITPRGEGRRSAFVAQLLQKGRFGIACIGYDPDNCRALVLRTMRPPDTLARPAWPTMALPDGRVLTFLTIERPRPGA